MSHVPSMYALCGKKARWCLSQMFRFRHMRFFSRPPFTPDPKGAAASMAELDITGIPPPVDWPAPPEVRCCCVGT